MPAPKFIYWNPAPWDGVGGGGGGGGIWEVHRSWGCSLLNRLSALRKETPQSPSPLPVLAHPTRLAPWSWMSSLQRCETQMFVVYKRPWVAWDRLWASVTQFTLGHFEEGINVPPITPAQFSGAVTSPVQSWGQRVPGLAFPKLYNNIQHPTNPGKRRKSIWLKTSVILYN